MDTRSATRQFRLQQWSEIIRDRKASGLNVNDYCQLHDISRNSYFYWLKQIRRDALRQAGFVELPASAPSLPEPVKKPTFETYHTELVIRTDKAELHVNSDTPSELLRRVMSLMQD